MSEGLIKEGEIVPAGHVKPGNVIKNQLNEKTYEFIKIGNVSRCKTGKHGSAKIILEGNETKTKTFRKMILTGNDRVKLANFKRLVVEICEYFEDLEMYSFLVPDQGGGSIKDVYVSDIEESVNKRFQEDWKKFTEGKKEPIEGEPPRCVVKVILWEDGSFGIDE